MESERTKFGERPIPWNVPGMDNVKSGAGPGLEDGMRKLPRNNTLTMVISQGLFIMGEMQADGRLRRPRVVSFLDQGKRVQLSPLPGVPGYMYVGVGNPFYPVPAHDKSLYDLYAQVTAPNVDPNID